VHDVQPADPAWPWNGATSAEAVLPTWSLTNTVSRPSSPAWLSASSRVSAIVAPCAHAEVGAVLPEGPNAYCRVRPLIMSTAGIS
jgi:hypothetical protein